MNNILENSSKYINNFVKIFRRKGILTQSAALTYVTLLSFIPFSLFIIFLLPDLKSATLGSKINNLLIDTFLPSQVEYITESFSGLLHRKLSLNIVNILMLFVTSYSLFRVIIKTFDNILNVHERHKNGFFENLIKFLGTIVFGFLFMFIMYSASSMSIISSFFDWSFLAKFNTVMIPFFLIIIFITLIFFFLPTIEVNKLSIFKSAFITSSVWLLTKIIFNLYITYLTNLQVVYGVLASIPIFLIWIYLNWIIILSGVVWITIFENRFSTIDKQSKLSRGYKISFEVIDHETEIDEDTLSLNKEKLKKVFEEITNG
ncbi:MAG: YihY/virulence factor BrkB family protein [Candidatus Cloacimonadota bacterium]|nr:YihY/virulence factor BrkB family protein [Candidatus Cloacimonadota bacterium]